MFITGRHKCLETYTWCHLNSNDQACGLMSGIREAEINVAEGKKQARILSSEAYKLEQINQARGPFTVVKVVYNCLGADFHSELVI